MHLSEENVYQLISLISSNSKLKSALLHALTCPEGQNLAARNQKVSEKLMVAQTVKETMHQAKIETVSELFFRKGISSRSFNAFWRNVPRLSISATLYTIDEFLDYYLQSEHETLYTLFLSWKNCGKASAEELMRAFLEPIQEGELNAHDRRTSGSD